MDNDGMASDNRKPLTSEGNMNANELHDYMQAANGPNGSELWDCFSLGGCVGGGTTTVPMQMRDSGKEYSFKHPGATLLAPGHLDAGSPGLEWDDLQWQVAPRKAIAKTRQYRENDGLTVEQQTTLVEWQAERIRIELAGGSVEPKTWQEILGIVVAKVE